ncbi:MAG: hypothetical protein HYZ71_07880 [Deltaproteobacteria bacterium]|nr:hypothetical protein [Deltaproteobacteria bacterium]
MQNIRIRFTAMLTTLVLWSGLALGAGTVVKQQLIDSEFDVANPKIDKETGLNRSVVPKNPSEILDSKRVRSTTAISSVEFYKPEELRLFTKGTTVYIQFGNRDQAAACKVLLESRTESKLIYDLYNSKVRVFGDGFASHITIPSSVLKVKLPTGEPIPLDSYVKNPGKYQMKAEKDLSAYPRHEQSPSRDGKAHVAGSKKVEPF